jgi:hypothetical protein
MRMLSPPWPSISHAPLSNAQFYKLKLYTALSFNKQDMILLPPRMRWYCCLFAQHGVIVMPDT